MDVVDKCGGKSRARPRWPEMYLFRSLVFQRARFLVFSRISDSTFADGHMSPPVVQCS